MLRQKVIKTKNWDHRVHMIKKKSKKAIKLKSRIRSNILNKKTGCKMAEIDKKNRKRRLKV